MTKNHLRSSVFFLFLSLHIEPVSNIISCFNAGIQGDISLVVSVSPFYDALP